MAKNEVAVAPNNTEAALFVSDEMFTGSTGLENVTAADLLIPRLTIIQKMSPQLDKSEPNYISGCEYGDIVDTATNETFKEIVVVPCFFAMQYLEWAPRTSGKGLIANHGTDASVMKQTKLDENHRNVLPNGNYIVESATWYVLNLTAGGRRSFIPLSSTGLKHSRRWLTLIAGEKLKRPDGSSFTPPLYYRSWIVNTVEEKNQKGSWKAFKFTPSDPILALDPSKSLLSEAKEFCEQAKDGLVKGDLSHEGEVAQHGSDVPF